MFRLGEVEREPFPHMVVDGFADEAVLREIVAQWPTEGWNRKAVRTSIKSDISRTALMPHAAKALICELYGDAFCKRLGDAFGLELHPDPSAFAEGVLKGGGLHEIHRGGHLGMHVDFNRHTQREWVRVANLLIYLNEDWQDEWRGHLRIEHEDGRLAKAVAPVFNRMVCFATSEKSWHGHPEPLECPAGVSRKSIALYYYSRSAEAGESHSTIYR